MRLGDIVVEVRDRSLKRLGAIRPEEIDLEATIMFNNVGTWKLNLSPDHPMAPALRAPGAGLIVTGEADVLFSGPSTGPSFTASANAPYGTLTINGVTDDIVLADRVCYPEPSNADPTHQTLAQDIRTGKAETVIHGFVNANCGPGAVAARRLAGLTMGTNYGRGPTITKSARFDVLGSLIADIALMAGLGFRVVQRGSGLKFETSEVIDRSSMIRLDIWNNTLASQSVTVAPPTATQVLVAGQGDLTARQFYQATNADALAAEAAWGRRIERFIDQRQTDDTSEHAQKANEVLAAEGKTAVVVKVEPMDDETMVLGRDWSLGDLIATVTDDGEYAAIATSLTIKADRDGFRAGVGLGDLSKLDRSWATFLQQTAKRVAQLERAK